jgi:hypothetical protein
MVLGQDHSRLGGSFASVPLDTLVVPLAPGVLKTKFRVYPWLYPPSVDHQISRTPTQPYAYGHKEV